MIWSIKGVFDAAIDHVLFVNGLKIRLTFL